MICVVDLDCGIEPIAGVFELMEFENRFDEIGIEGTLDFAFLELFENMEPGFAGREEEADLREVGFRVL